MAGGSDVIIRASPVFWFREGRARLGARQLSGAESFRNARFWKVVNRWETYSGSGACLRVAFGGRTGFVVLGATLDPAP